MSTTPTDRSGCCATWRKPCLYHEGVEDGRNEERAAVVAWPTAHEMTVALLDALGMHSGARPETPQQVWEMALAAVRERTGEAEVERAAVVAWLRNPPGLHPAVMLADRFERGEHRGGTDTP